MILISKTQDIACDECDSVATPEMQKKDTLRMHRVGERGILCECCYEDYQEKFSDNYD